MNTERMMRGAYMRAYVETATYTSHDHAAYDFWLTRCGHGAGFWDGDWPEDIGEKLTELAHEFGNVDLYVGDDGVVYA